MRLSTDQARILVAKLDRRQPLARAEAAALRAWAAAEPAVMAAYWNKDDPAHRACADKAKLVFHFEHDHPADSDGAPAPWPADLAPLSAPEPQAAADGAPASPPILAADGSPLDRAAARARRAAILADLAGPYWDVRHPQHRATVEDVTLLTAAITGDHSMADALVTRPHAARAAEVGADVQQTAGADPAPAGA